MADPLPEMLEPFDDLSGRMDAELVEIILDCAFIKADGFVILAHSDKCFHRHGLPVGKRGDHGSKLSKLLHPVIVLPVPEQVSGLFDTGGKNLLIPDGFADSPHIACLHREELSPVAVACFKEIFQALGRIPFIHCLIVKILKFTGILNYFDLICPVKDILVRKDVIDLGKTGLFEVFLCIIDDAAQGMMRVVNFPVPEKKLLKTVTSNTALSGVDQDLKQCIILGDRRLRGARDRPSVIAHGKTTEHLHAQDVLLFLYCSCHD